MIGVRDFLRAGGGLTDDELAEMMRAMMAAMPAIDHPGWLKQMELSLDGYGGGTRLRAVQRVKNILRQLGSEIGEMTGIPANLDDYRGMSAQRDTDERRRLVELQADQAVSHLRTQEFETNLLSRSVTTWPEAGAKARYLMSLFAQTSDADNPLRQRLIASTLADIVILSDRDK